MALYFGVLVGIAYFTSKGADSGSYFLGNKQSPWYAVAFGMLGDSLSGVTFISVPGAVGGAQFSYLQLVLGYMAGYLIISRVLLPLYYRLNLTSIYAYLEGRYGRNAQKTGAFFFILSRLLGAAGRLYLAATVIQLFVFDAIGIPFWLSVTIIIALIFAYTYRGGIKTLVWTDTFQSTILLLAVLCSVVVIASKMDLSLGGVVNQIAQSDYSKVFFWDWAPKTFFFKQFIGGAFIAVVMTGLDQNMMQKNLSCKSLPDAQKNMEWFSVVMALVNVCFLSLGALLWIYATQIQLTLPTNALGKPITDYLFPTLAFNQLGTAAGLLFILGLTAATFSSADSVLTTLTTSFYHDFLELHKKTASEAYKERYRHAIHIGFAVLLLGVILLFKLFNNAAIIDTVLLIANYTYGPLLGLFFFGILTRRGASDKWIPWIALAAPALCWVVNSHSQAWWGGYQFGNELLLLNGALTAAMLWMAKAPRRVVNMPQ
ncbi:MAG TPA: sodium:solute symporter [Luteibaculaceae bacterium]|nr:sodium:solute symporter [Luteibaculaceae bacterium]